MVLDFLKGKYGLQLWAFLFLALISWILFQVLGLFVLNFTTSVSMEEAMDVMNMNVLPLNPEGYSVFFIMLFFQSLGLFVIPGLLFPLLIGTSVKNYFSFDIRKKTTYLFLLPILAIPGLIIVSFLGEWNMKLNLPQFFHDMEKNATETVTYLLSFNETTYILSTTLLMAVFPAIGEELFFRGVVQQLIVKWTKKHWIGILITAFIFSAIHFQFLTFLPRFFMGIVLGYLFVWTKNILFPILAHFFHNFISIMLGFYSNNQEIGEAQTLNIWLVLGAIIVFSGVFFTFYSSFQKNHVS